MQPLLRRQSPVQRIFQRACQLQHRLHQLRQAQLRQLSQQPQLHQLCRLCLPSQLHRLCQSQRRQLQLLQRLQLHEGGSESGCR